MVFQPFGLQLDWTLHDSDREGDAYAAPSFLRFGHFEHHARSGPPGQLSVLAAAPAASHRPALEVSCSS